MHLSVPSLLQAGNPLRPWAIGVIVTCFLCLLPKTRRFGKLGILAMLLLFVATVSLRYVLHTFAPGETSPFWQTPEKKKPSYSSSEMARIKSVGSIAPENTSLPFSTRA